MGRKLGFEPLRSVLAEGQTYIYIYIYIIWKVHFGDISEVRVQKAGRQNHQTTTIKMHARITTSAYTELIIHTGGYEGDKLTATHFSAPNTCIRVHRVRKSPVRWIKAIWPYGAKLQLYRKIKYMGSHYSGLSAKSI